LLKVYIGDAEPLAWQRYPSTAKLRAFSPPWSRAQARGRRCGR